LGSAGAANSRLFLVCATCAMSPGGFSVMSMTRPVAYVGLCLGLSGYREHQPQNDRPQDHGALPFFLKCPAGY